jgi:hypothetical protein
VVSSLRGSRFQRTNQTVVNNSRGAEECRSQLESFFDFSAAEATGANPDAPCRSVNHGADTLQVGVERPFRLIVGVTDIMAGLVFF